MGISIQEFLAGREPCEVCDASGNQNHCITELLSRQDSCILFNAIEHNQDDQTWNDTVLLQELRYITDANKVLEYYIRSQKITENINARSNKIDIWNSVHETYVKQILEKARNFEREQAFKDIMTMVESMERTYGIKH